MSTNNKSISGFWLLVLIVIGLYLAYIIVVLLAKTFVYLGHNCLFFLDAMLQVSAVNPVVMWGFLGVFAGGVVGVGIAIKKFRLPKKLIIYPALVLVAFVAIMCLINKPAQYEVNENPIYPYSTPTSETMPVAPVTRYYYKSTKDITIRQGPSLNTAKAFILERGTTVEMVQRFFYDARNAEWMKIRHNDQEGYVNVKFMRRSDSAPINSN